MKQVRSTLTVPLISIAILLAVIAGCSMQPSEQHKPRTTLFIGVDASGSFKNSGYYDNALTFLAHYIYGHLNELGGLEKPKMLFVASVGGKSRSEPKTFHPIHDFPLGRPMVMRRDHPYRDPLIPHQRLRQVRYK